MNENDIVRSITIKVSTEGTDQAKSDMQGLASAQDKLAASSENVAQVTETTAKRQTSAQTALDRLTRQYDPAAKALFDLERAQSVVNRALGQNPALQEQANSVLELANAKYQKAIQGEKELGNAHAGLSTQSQALAHGLRTGIEEIALGIPITQVATQQFSHLSYAATGPGGLTGAFSEVGGVLKSAGSALVGFFSNPVTAAIAGTAALGAGAIYVATSWNNAEKEIDHSLLGIGARTGSTAADLNNFAKANASATGLSIGQAREVAVEFTKTGNITVAGLKGVGDAIHGFSVITGEDATKATQTFANALGGDLVKGAENLNKTYGVLDSGTLEYIRTLELQGDRSKAIQVIIDAMVPTNQKAADSVGILSRAWSGLGNVLSSIKNGPAPTPLPDQLAALQKQRDNAASANPVGSVFAGGTSQGVDALDQQIDALQKKIDAFTADGVVKQLKAMSLAGDSVVKSVIPQIDKIHELESALNTLQAAKNTPGVSRSLGQDDAAETAIQNQLTALKDSQAQAARYNDQVKLISGSWGDVSQSTALSLQAAQNQLPVVEAVGGAAKMAAQYAADYANAIDRGKSSVDAAALATSNLQTAAAQVESGAQQQLQTLQDQYNVVSATNVQSQIQAQGQSTFNQLLSQGVSYETARAVASQQVANAQAQTYEKMQKQVQASQDNLDLARAAGTADEARLKSDIAYRNAIQQGATAGQAAAISANVLALETMKAADASQQLAENFENAARAASDAAAVKPGSTFGNADQNFGSFNVAAGAQTTVGGAPSLGYILGVGYVSIADYNAYQAGKLVISTAGQLSPAPTSEGSANKALAMGGGIDAAISAISKPNYFSDTTDTSGFSTLSSLYDLKNGQTSDKSLQASNLKQEVAFLQTLPETLARDQAIARQTQAIQSLTSSVNSNTTATNDNTVVSQEPCQTLDQIGAGIPDSAIASRSEVQQASVSPGGSSLMQSIQQLSDNIATANAKSGSATTSPTVNINVAPSVTADTFIASRAQISRAFRAA